jgi:trans-2,3-dihydro-3-hydroxyanthranilate isomerase
LQIADCRSLARYTNLQSAIYNSYGEDYMRKLHYHLVDVFTDRPFGGNQLAVFTNGRGISTEKMQALAKELNLSETVFVLPAEEAGNDYALRIFTPKVELPFAGHPTIGTTFILAHEHMIFLTGEEATARLEEKVGTIPVTIKIKDGAADFIQMKQPLPTFGPAHPDPEAIARMLSLEPEALDSRYSVEAVSCGVPFLFVPLKDLAAVRRAQLKPDIWEQVLSGFAAPHVFIFTTEVETEGSTVHGRMFAPAMGIAEDPATGAASGPLGCYLVKYGLVEAKDKVKIISEQGFEMGRPSFLHIEIETMDGAISGVYVGGQSYYMGEGYFELG